MINTEFFITDWTKDSPVSIPTLTPYDAIYLIEVREQVNLFITAVENIREDSRQTVSPTIDELNRVIYENGLQDRIKVNENPINFLIEVYGPSWDLEYYWIIKRLKDSIRDMDPDAKNKSCPKCSNWLVITGSGRFHYSTVIHYFCLGCGAIYEWYRNADTDVMERKYRLNRHHMIE